MEAAFLEPHLRVVVHLGSAVSEVYGQPKVCATATVLGPAQSGPHWWLAVDVPGSPDTLPQMYLPKEILGLGTWLQTI